MTIKLNEFKKLGQFNNSIYLIKNPKGKIYIGKFVHIDRLYQYLNLNSIKNQVKLHRSINKYGIQNHSIQILKTIPTSNGLQGLQKFYIQVFNSFNNGLNCTIGGGGFTKYSDSFCSQIWDMNRNGMNFNQISIKLNIDHKSVIQFINRTGNIPIRHKQKFSQNQKQACRNNRVGKFKFIPQFAKDQFGQMKKVLAKDFRNCVDISQWHDCCNKLNKRLKDVKYRYKIKTKDTI